MTLAAALLLAFVIDLAWGEPPPRWHPVVWMGRYLGWAGRRIAPMVSPDVDASDARRGHDWRRFGLGAMAWWVGAAAVAALAWGLQVQLLAHAPAWLAAPLLALALKPLFAWALLRNEVLAVEAALGESLAAGRARLAWLVSRDVSALSEAEVRESAIESLAENLNDSVVAPLFWFALLGLPGAALYRFANTADAMWGYPGPRREADGTARDWAWAGKWAARADDLLSWLPARLTAGLLWLVGPGKNGGRGGLRREAARTPSPNSGWPMAAMALALGVRLGKPGVYVLHPAGRAPMARDTRRAAVMATRAVLVSLPGWLLALMVVA